MGEYVVGGRRMTRNWGSAVFNGAACLGFVFLAFDWPARLWPVADPTLFSGGFDRLDVVLVTLLAVLSALRCSADCLQALIPPQAIGEQE